MEEAEETDAIRDGYNNDFRIFLDESMAIILRICRAAHIESATVDPHDYRFLLSSIVRLPKVQIQAVLTRRI